MKLLPENKQGLGWTPFAWLIYLPTFLIDPVIRWRAGIITPWYVAATIAGLAVFLVLYFRGFWARGRELERIAWLNVALGVAFAPINSGSSIFFVYGAAFAGQLGKRSIAWSRLAVFTAIAIVTCLVTDAQPYFWITAVIFTPLIGAINLHFAEVAQTQLKLRMAQDQVEHLAAVAERERIARDLHDVLGHTLSLIVIKSELASRICDRDPERAAQEMRDVESVSRKALQDVRNTIRGYRPTIDDEVARARSLLKAAQIRGDFDMAELTLDRAREETLAFALREAVTNVVRHSNGSECRVTTRTDGGNVVLAVWDDGNGRIAAEGSGLRGMRERVEVFGGTVTCTNGNGVTLTVVVPAS